MGDDGYFHTVTPSPSGINVIRWGNHGVLYVRGRTQFNFKDIAPWKYPIGFTTDDEVIVLHNKTPQIGLLQISYDPSKPHRITQTIDLPYPDTVNAKSVVSKMYTSYYNGDNFGVVVKSPEVRRHISEISFYSLVVRYKGVLYKHVLHADSARFQLAQNHLLIVRENKTGFDNFTTEVFDLDYATEDDLLAKCIYRRTPSDCKPGYKPKTRDVIDPEHGRYLINTYYRVSEFDGFYYNGFSCVDLRSDAKEETFFGDDMRVRSDITGRQFIRFSRNAVSVDNCKTWYSLRTLLKVSPVNLRDAPAVPPLFGFDQLYQTHIPWQCHRAEQTNIHGPYRYESSSASNYWYPGWNKFRYVISFGVDSRDREEETQTVLEIQLSRRRSRTAQMTGKLKYKVEDHGIDFVARARLWLEQ